MQCCHLLAGGSVRQRERPRGAALQGRAGLQAPGKLCIPSSRGLTAAWQELPAASKQDISQAGSAGRAGNAAGHCVRGTGLEGSASTTRAGELPSRGGAKGGSEQPRARQTLPPLPPGCRTCRMGSGMRKRQQALTRRTAVPRLTRWPTDTYRGLELLLWLRSTWAARKERSGTGEAHLNTHTEGQQS